MGLVQALDLDAANIPRIATGLGGGVGRHGEICGVLLGAAMAIGLKHGRTSDDDPDARARTYPRVDKLITAFEKEFGKVRCIELTGCDFRTLEGAERFAKENLHATLCTKLVAFVAHEAERLMTGD